jgi:hypothetical protein
LHNSHQYNDARNEAYYGEATGVNRIISKC